MNMDVINGNLGEFRQFKEGTLQHLDQVVGAFRFGVDEIYTADGFGYFVNNGKAKLAVTRGEYNPLLHLIREQGFEKIEQQIKNNGAYWIKPGKAKSNVSAESTQIFDLESLGCYHDNEYGVHVEAKYKSDEINSWDYHSFFENTDVELRRFMQRFGLDHNGFGVLTAATTSFSKLYVKLFPPSLVKKRLETEGGSLWCASHVGPDHTHFYRQIVISATNSIIGRSAKLIGTLNDGSSTTNGVQENPLSQHYHQILADPTEAVKAMDDRTAQGLLKIIADYKKSRDK